MQRAAGRGLSQHLQEQGETDTSALVYSALLQFLGFKNES